MIKTNGSCIWNKARVLYKRAITTSPSILKSQVMVEFCGEEGADAGALKLQFFEKVLQHVNEDWVNDSALPFIGRTWLPMSTPSCISNYGV